MVISRGRDGRTTHLRFTPWFVLHGSRAVSFLLRIYSSTLRYKTESVNQIEVGQTPALSHPSVIPRAISCTFQLSVFSSLKWAYIILQCSEKILVNERGVC